VPAFIVLKDTKDYFHQAPQMLTLFRDFEILF